MTFLSCYSHQAALNNQSLFAEIRIGLRWNAAEPSVPEKISKYCRGRIFAEVRRASLGLDSGRFSCVVRGVGEKKPQIKSQPNNRNSINCKCAVSIQDLDGEIKVDVVGSRKKSLCSRSSFKMKENIRG